MPITTLSSSEFNQDISAAKKAANTELVFITDRGSPTHVLMSIDEYRRLTATHANIDDLLAMPDADRFEFEPSKLESLESPQLY